METGHMETGHTDLPLSLSSRAIFWKPRHTGASPLLVHLPFLFWVMETARPTTVVQIGLGDGTGFMALCQAIDKLGLEAVCMGIDLQSAAASAPAPIPAPAPATVPRQDTPLTEHAALYGDFSFIVPVAPDTVPPHATSPHTTSPHTTSPHGATRHLKEAQIDLLIIDACLDDAMLEQLRSSWEPLLSDRAIVMLHDPQGNAAGARAQAWLDSLRQDLPSLSFPQAGRGLDVVLRGPEQPGRLVRFAGLEPGMAGYLTTRQVFMRLGQALEQESQAGLQADALRQATAELDAAQDELAGAIAQLAGRDAALADMAARMEEAQTAATAAQEQLERRQAEVEQLTAIAEEARNRAGQLSDTLAQQGKELQAERAALERKLADKPQTASGDTEALRRTHAAQAQELARVQAARDAALAEMADQLHTARTTAGQLEAGQTRLTTELTRLTRRLLDLQAERDTLQSQLEDQLSETEALRNSTSWKVTRPLRKIKQGIA